MQIVTSGVDAMTMQLLLELSSMANQAEAAVAAITSIGGAGGGGGNGSSGITPPNLNSSQWNFIYNVGTVVSVHARAIRSSLSTEHNDMHPSTYPPTYSTACLLTHPYTHPMLVVAGYPSRLCM